MKEYIDKTTYIEFLECPKNTWLKLHKPELLILFELSEFDKSLLEKGNLVESLAQKLFPNGILIGSWGKDAAKVTKEHLDNKTPILFQPTTIHDKYLARHDVMEYDQNLKQWNLYEIKGKNSCKENQKEMDHIEDASFQAVILRENGIYLNKIFIIHLNKDYIRQDDVDIKSLFAIEDVTDKVKAREENTRIKMQKSKEALFSEQEDIVACECIYKGRSAHCTTFKYSHPHIPEYSVHDIARIGNSKKKLENLVEAGVFDLNDIPEGFELSDIQNKQVMVHRIQQPIIDHQAISKELNHLEYPLYFLDYETYSPAIPLYKGYKPYQNITFQFSLHILNNPDANPIHFEYIHETDTDPSLSVIHKLKERVGKSGNVIVWNKTFEQGRNKEMADRNPEYKDFLISLNERVYDLIDIFKDQNYVHPGFRGKTSIKNVLPVLVPELTYKDLEIKEGGVASQKWYEMMFGELSQVKKAKIAYDLKKYCGLDTYAMYAIWAVLIGKVIKPEIVPVTEG